MSNNNSTLVEKFNTASQMGFLDKYKDIPETITKNINTKYHIRPYQNEAIARFTYYLSDQNPLKTYPIHLLFNMATGSGKTLLMAANILYLYQLGYRRFIYFVNSTNVIDKTKTNFLDKASPKYLFNESIVIDNTNIKIQEVNNFELINKDNINIIFTTIQGLHSKLTTPQENSLVIEDFNNMDVVFLSDEAHHINALTKNWSRMTKTEREENTSWENTINKILQCNPNNIMLEYTATIDLSNQAIRDKYKDKIIYKYSLKEFREDKYSKDVHIIRSDMASKDRALQAVVLSQYKRKIAEKYNIYLKPVILVKSQKTIAQSEETAEIFNNLILNLNAEDIKKIENHNPYGILRKAFIFFKNNGITFDNLVREIKQDFSEEKCLSINSKSDSEEKQIIVNTLEEKNNEYRVIFTVNMLNEGWDVLNLYDIVRFYETRDTKYSKPGSTTISEAQLIGRGARYFPFKIEEDQDPFKRKYDEDDVNTELKVLETLHYHSINDSRYISEIKAELVRTGIQAPDDKKKEITVNIKDKIKNTDFWKNGLIFLNDRRKKDLGYIKSLDDIINNINFKYILKLDRTFETKIFEEIDGDDIPTIGNQTEKLDIRFNSIEPHINRKALDKNSFYFFNNLKKFFPNLSSINEFIASDEYLGKINIEVYGPKEHLKSINNYDKYNIALTAFTDLAKIIQNNITEYEGTKVFKGYSLCNKFPESKTSEILTNGIDKEYGILMSKTNNQELYLDLSHHDWYAYSDNYGTSEEKYLIQFIRYKINDLKKKYKDIYLLRNESFFKIYRFSDGKAMEPDFVLFLNEKDTGNPLNYQLFIEPKGDHLIRNDEWKENFLLDIEQNYQIETLFENNSFRLIGLPFYNERLTKSIFDKKLQESIKYES